MGFNKNLLIVVWTLLLGPGCSRSEQPRFFSKDNWNTSQSPASEKGSALDAFFKFDDKEVTTFALYKNHPDSTHSWNHSAAFFRLTPPLRNRQWSLSLPEWQNQSKNQPDARANSPKINHLLDALRAATFSPDKEKSQKLSLQSKQAHTSQPSSNTLTTASLYELANLGLAPCVWTVQWLEREICLGLKSSQGERWAVIKSKSYQSFGVIGGAFLSLLEDLKNLADLKEKRLIAIDPDEVDEIKVTLNGHSTILVRSGDVWESNRSANRKLSKKGNTATSNILVQRHIEKNEFFSASIKTALQELTQFAIQSDEGRDLILTEKPVTLEKQLSHFSLVLSAMGQTKAHLRWRGQHKPKALDAMMVVTDVLSHSTYKLAASSFIKKLSPFLATTKPPLEHQK